MLYVRFLSVLFMCSVLDNLVFKNEDKGKNNYGVCMRRLILFSIPTKQVKQAIVPLMFPEAIQHKVFAYMPSEGVSRNKKYESFTNEWRAIAQQYEAQFLLIDNAKEDAVEERAKLSNANILLITGGNPCILLRNLHKSGMNNDIIELAHKEQCILAGYSAGAMIFSPTIEMAARDDNIGVGLTNLDAFNFVDYEIFPHYSEETKQTLEKYSQVTQHVVKPLRDDEYIVVEDFSKDAFASMIGIVEGPTEADYNDIYR